MTYENENVTPSERDTPITNGEETDHPVPTWLRVTVIVLGVAIIIMLGLIVGTIVKRAINSDAEETAPVAVTGITTVIEDRQNWPTEIAMTIPEGMVLVGADFRGKFGLFHFRGNGENIPDSAESFLIINQATGEKTRINVGNLDVLQKFSTSRKPEDPEYVNITVPENTVIGQAILTDSALYIDVFDSESEILKQVSSVDLATRTVNHIKVEDGSRDH